MTKNTVENNNTPREKTSIERKGIKDMFELTYKKNATQGMSNTWVRGECKHRNIDPIGDPMVKRREKDGIHQMGHQNIQGTTLNSGLEIADELDLMKEFGTDTQGMPEINKPWNMGNQWKYQMMMDFMFKNSKNGILLGRGSIQL